jgi:glucosamine--fructose-6-phosphate aminotransferase (isomerizing)
MCGIVGYIGNRVATPLLIDGLKRLEYRGYDSAGIAIMNGKGVETRKAAGKISKLETAVTSQPVHGSLGIADSRWATLGAPSEGNDHRLLCCTSEFAVGHYGILEHATALRQ